MLSSIGGISYAQEYKVKYQAEYFPDLKDNCLVKLDINFRNTRSDVYIKQYGLIFPKGFEISNLNISDDDGPIQFVKTEDERYIKLKFEFLNPKMGINKENNFHLKFDQKNLFKNYGNIWEVILPAIPPSDDSTYDVIVNLPQNSNKKISIAKPVPTKIENGKIYWTNLKSRIIYATFGDSQFYEVNLNYNLKNDQLGRVNYEIALPPETLYQKVFVNSLDPLPEKVYIDTDGNYMAKYTVGVGQNEVIKYSGVIQILKDPQEDMIENIRKQYESQSKYLLTVQPYWDISKIKQSNEIAALKTAKDIYKYTSTKLNYDYSRINKNIKRLGAYEVFTKPNTAVCMEFTDLFIALCREKGIAAREINGFGFGNDTSIRPASFFSDILHAWPEYYDEKAMSWMSVDPTWENTSGIDFFNSLDFNHLIFAIQGKDSTYPLPAGMYKTTDTKDVDVKIASSVPKENGSLEIIPSIRNEIDNKSSYDGSIKIVNNSNVFIKNSFIDIKSVDLKVNSQKIKIDLLPPFGSMDYDLKYQAVNQSSTGTTFSSINFYFRENLISKNQIKVSSFYQDLFYKIFGIFIGFVLITVTYILASKQRKNQHG
jgi:transglutaminase-like putative cysteine protease